VLGESGWPEQLTTDTAVCCITGMSRRKMTDCGEGTEGPRGTSDDSAISGDATILKRAMRKAIRSSPDSFLTTLVDIKAMSPDDWRGEIRSSTWVVAKRRGRVVGVAACKRPDPEKDKEDAIESRYIESVWIAPKLRGKRLAERLINYLIEAEYRKNQFVGPFLLWVFTTNLSAIKLYDRLGFVQVAEQQKGIRIELKYRLDVNSGTGSRMFPVMDGTAFLADKQEYGVTYRVLGEWDSAKLRFSWRKVLPIESTRSRLVKYRRHSTRSCYHSNEGYTGFIRCLL
jgi:ribosomal protein S18 acetylase RimI-like enzyme